MAECGIFSDKIWRCSGGKKVDLMDKDLECSFMDWSDHCRQIPTIELMVDESHPLFAMINNYTLI